HRAKSEFTAAGKKYAAGSYVILLAQPYRANVKCLFEAQHYPDRRIYPGGPAEQPYDVAGWTLPMQMGVDYAGAEKRFDAELERIDAIRPAAAAPGGRPLDAPPDSATTFCISPNKSKAFAFVNLLFKS